ncbi:MAG TPA: DUF4870 domain-containing protein [Actinotalea sp.]
MTSTPSDEPLVPEPGTTPPPPPPAAPGGYGSPVPPPAAPAPGYQAPPAYGAPQPGYAPQTAYGSSTAGVPLSDSDQRLWATLGHIGGVLLGFVAPLVVWLIYKDRGRFVEEQSKEALNFQILVAIGYVVGSVTTVVGIGLLILPLVWIMSVIFSILAAVAANKGEAYRYPLNWRIVK